LNASIARRKGTSKQNVGQKEVVRKDRGQGAIGVARRTPWRVLCQQWIRWRT